MQDESPSHAEQVALFRYGLIADLIHLRPGGGRAGRYGRYVKLREKAAAAYTIPGSRRTRVAAEAIRGWLHDYREHGFEGLKPKPRADVGTTRHIPQHVADLLVALKDEHRDWTIPTVVAKARRMAAAGEADVPEDLALPTSTVQTSTVHRLLTRAGVMDKPKESPTTKDRRRFAYDRAGELWMSDVMHGPAVVVDGRRKRKAYLVALLDDATRIVPFCAFTLSENTAAFLPVLEQGVMRRGIPKRLYVDNGSAYRSHHLALVCARLGITLVHARPHSPQGKGKQERWFRTVRMQFCATLREGDLASLEVLNRKLWAWVEGEYQPEPAQGARRQDPLRCLGHVLGRRPPARARARPARDVPLRAEAQGARRPHGQPRRRGVRGRRGARRRDGDLALQPLQARSSHRRLASGQEDPDRQARRRVRQLLRATGAYPSVGSIPVTRRTRLGAAPA